MSLLKLSKFELRKLFKDKTAHAGLIYVLVVTFLYALLNYLNRPEGTYTGTEMIMDSVYVQNSVLFTIPLVAILLSVHSLCEEFSTGTIRTLMTKNVRRENILASKTIALFVYLCVCVYSTLVISALVGLKWGYPGDAVSFIPRLLFIYFEYVLSAMILVVFSFLVASLGGKTIVTAFATLGFLLTFVILELFTQVRTYIYTYHVTSSIQLLLAPTINARLLFQSLAVLLIYLFGILLAAATILEKRNIRV